MEFEGDIRSRLNRLEQKVDFLLNELGLTQKAEASLPAMNPLHAEIVALLTQNRKIEAIKVYREHMGVGLKEAKDVIDNMVY
ncbi:MAG TPA: ribosomal protein L7/L12 [Ktedonobacteraceae bacterium]|nr:ribosomal protein L7/L12 [Ktedonobacteraceae bacterium]